MVLERVKEAVGNKLQQTAKVLDEVVAQRFPYRHQLLERDDMEESDEECEQNPRQQRPQIMQAATVPPQDLVFTVPEDKDVGDPVCVQGPHGPLLIPLPEGAKAGEECRYRLGPECHYDVEVPKDAKEGDAVAFKGMAGEQLHALVPKGVNAGEKFKVSPPVVMVHVPRGARPGQMLSYTSPLGIIMCTPVPPGVAPGHYFPALYEVPQPGAPAPVSEPKASEKPEDDCTTTTTTAPPPSEDLLDVEEDPKAEPPVEESRSGATEVPPQSEDLLLVE